MSHAVVALAGAAGSLIVTAPWPTRLTAWVIWGCSTYVPAQMSIVEPAGTALSADWIVL